MALCLAEYVSFQPLTGLKSLVRTSCCSVFSVFLVSFVTSIYPFLRNRVLPISTNMVDEPQIDARFDVGSC